MQTLYNEVQCSEVLLDEKDNVWGKFPSNLFVKDKTGWTKVTRLVRKERHRDLVRVKTAFGEDIIVTDNHPMIVNDNKNDTVEAANALNYKQFRTYSSLVFE